MASNENSRMLMPWPVKVVWWWYLTLVCASCIPLVFCLVKCDPFGRGELFQLLAGTAPWAAYFSGLALAVRRGRRGWATVPYGVAGLLMIMIGGGGRLALRIVAEKRTGPFRGCRSDHFPHCASALAVVEGLVPTLAEAEAAGRRLRMVVWRVCCRVSRGKY